VFVLVGGGLWWVSLGFVVCCWVVLACEPLGERGRPPPVWEGGLLDRIVDARTGVSRVCPLVGWWRHGSALIRRTSSSW
jgi:hypothetical protein